MQPVKTKKKLSRADKKQIEAAIARANRTDKKGKSAQDSIPYERMWPDGICRVSDSHYTKTIYNTGSRTGLINSLREMRGELSPEETELRELTDSALTKLCAMTDEDFAQLELYPDFDQ